MNKWKRFSAFRCSGDQRKTVKDLCVMTWIQGITDFLVWVLFPALVLRRICFAFLVYAIGGVVWMRVILFAALRRFRAMAAMTICAWVLATPKQRAMSAEETFHRAKALFDSSCQGTVRRGTVVWKSAC